MTRVELLVGARTRRQLHDVQVLLSAIQTLPLDEPAADRAAEVKRHLDREGQSIGMADSLIAGIVLAHDAILLTRNARHFGRVPGLVLSMMANER